MTGRQGSGVLRSGDGETMFDRPGATVRVLDEPNEVTLTLFHYGPGEKGPGLHVHRRHTDAFYVLAGADADGLFSLRELELSPGATAATQDRDAGASEILYVLEGAAAVRLDGQEVEARPGDVAFVPAGVVREVATVGGEPTLLLSLAAPTA